MSVIRSDLHPTQFGPGAHRWAGLLTGLLMLGLGLTGGPVRAAPTVSCGQDALCSAQFKQASQLYQDGQYARAVLAFQAAHDRRPEPRILVNIGRTLQKMGHFKDALDYYERSQAAAPNDAALQASVGKFIVETRAQLEASLHPAPPPPAPSPEVPQPEGTVPEPEPAPITPDEPKESVPMLLQLPYGLPVVNIVVAPNAARPVYKKWWFWTLLGVATAGGVTAIAVAATRHSDTPALPADVRSYYPAF